jgi:hypothetical protein
VCGQRRPLLLKGRRPEGRAYSLTGIDCDLSVLMVLA